MKPTEGHLILLNGASSAGKTTLCKSIRELIPAPFLHFSLDFFMFDADVLPKRRDPNLGITWPAMRPKIIHGFYNCISSLLSAGNNLVTDIIIEEDLHKNYVQDLQKHHNVLLVGVHCPLEELQRREKMRGDRGSGQAEVDFRTVHTFLTYDFEVDSLLDPNLNAERIIQKWAQERRSHES